VVIGTRNVTRAHNHRVAFDLQAICFELELGLSLSSNAIGSMESVLLFRHRRLRVRVSVSKVARTPTKKIKQNKTKQHKTKQKTRGAT
jgi:hypothetical protein